MTRGAERFTLAQVASELEADAVVEGSVVRSGDRLWISVQLVDVRSGRLLGTRVCTLHSLTPWMWRGHLSSRSQALSSVFRSNRAVHARNSGQGGDYTPQISARFALATQCK